MPTAFTGSLGWTGAHPIQLGGPPLVNTYSRPLASKAGPLGAPALPLLAHAYANDGVTPNATSATFGLVGNRPAIKYTTANGGLDQITLEVAAPIPGLALGNVIRLTEIGGPWPGFVYSGVIESFPDTLSPTGTKHEIVVSPFGWELTRVGTQLLYTQPVDIVQAVRDAVALTQHCSCDQVSVPPTTGIPLVSTSGGAVDFRGQKVNQVLDTCRSIAGPTWFWYCDELGRVWFQSQGSRAQYTFMGGQHYEERISNGGDIQDRVNQVPAIGGVPTGGSANVQATVTGTSANPGPNSIGVRALDPPISIPGVTDQATLTAIASGILGSLDVVWTRVQLKGLPPLGIPNEVHPGRVHGSQPGGAVVRFWEPGKTPLPETGAVAGYTGPFICQSVTYDGLYQQIEMGNVPITNQTDIDNMVQRWAQRAAAISLNVTAAALNLQQTLTGSFQSGTGAIAANGRRGTLWSLGQQEFAAIDPFAVTRAEQGNLQANGNSPALWGFRANDANGNPIFDSMGLIAVMTLLGSGFLASAQNITSSTPTLISNTAITINLTRAISVFIAYGASVSENPVGAGSQSQIDLFIDGVNQGAGNGPAIELQFAPTTTGADTASAIYSVSLAAGSHTIDLRGSTNGTAGLSVTQAATLVYNMGK